MIESLSGSMARIDEEYIIFVQILELLDWHFFHSSTQLHNACWQPSYSWTRIDHAMNCGDAIPGQGTRGKPGGIPSANFYDLMRPDVPNH